MNQKFLSTFAIVCAINALFPLETLAHGIGPVGLVHWGTKGVIAGVKKSGLYAHALGKGVGHGLTGAAKVATKAAIVPVVAAKKGLVAAKLLAPLTIPLALGGKALLAAKLALPVAVGAAIGAPVGALIGAKAGAIKGAIVGKAILATKLALAKKLALKTAAVAAAPVVIGAGIKAKIAGAGLGLLAKKALAVGAVATSAGASIKAASTKLKGFPQNVISSIALPTLPALPALPALPVAPALPVSKKGPTSIEYSLILNGPHTGYKHKKASFYSDRRKRSAEPDAAADAQAQAQRSANTQQLLQLVRSQNAVQCLQKVICELSANPNVHGNDGIRFGRSLISLETQTDKNSAAQYREAATRGAKLNSPNQCAKFFPTCAFKSQEIVRIGNQMIGNQG